jgi:micrococcal nuclease
VTPLVALVLALAAVVPAPPPEQVTISRVVDGDTVEATSPGGARVKVRVLGIDTPETRDPRKPVQCWGPEATSYAKAQLLGRRARLVLDPTQQTRDRYGRLLAYVVRDDGKDYSEAAARAGMARYYLYRKPVQHAAAIQAGEQAARSAHRGLWGPPCNGGL